MWFFLRKLLFVLFLLLFACFASAQYYEITSHTIEIAVDNDGFAQVTERFYLSFPTDFQLKEFRTKVAEMGASLDNWKAFDNRIFTYIGRESELNNAEVAFVDNSSKYLELKYSLSNPIAEKKSETARVVEFSFLTRFFESFVRSGLIVIPENTTIAVLLPSFSEVEKPVSPEATVGPNTVTWQGYKTSNTLTLNYKVIKQIANINLQDAIRAFISSPWFIVVIIIAAVLAVIVIAKRKQITGRIENYIIDHSDLSGKEEPVEEKEENP